MQNVQYLVNEISELQFSFYMCSQFLTLKLKSVAESLDMSHAKLKVKMSKSFGLVTLARNSQQFSLERKEDATGS